MKKKEIIEIIEEVIGVFSEGMKQELNGKSLSSDGVRILLNGVQTGLLKKIAMHEEESEDKLL